MAKKSRSRTAPPGTPKVSVEPASPDGPNRKIRKEDARRQREALQRKASHRKFYRWGVAAVIVVAAAVGGTAIAMNQGSSKTPTPKPSVLLGMQGNPPWDSGQQDLEQRLRVIGLPFGPKEHLVYHIHDLVQIFVNGKKETIPTYVGINYPAPQDQVFLAVLHTHDDTGIVHIESPDKRDYTLGQFFDLWGVPFSATRLGDMSNAGNKQVRVYVDGTLVTGDPRAVPFTQHKDIVVTYGTKAQLPDPIPSDYSGTISSFCAPGC